MRKTRLLFCTLPCPQSWGENYTDTLMSILYVDHSKLRRIKPNFRHSERSNYSYMSKIHRATSEKKHCLLIESDNVTFVMLCPVTHSNWGNLTVALCDIFKDVLAAFAAALCPFPHFCCCCNLSSLWQMHLCVLFCLLHNFQNYI